MKRQFKILGMGIDVARRLERPETLQRAVEDLGDRGFNLCMLYLEDAYVYRRHPAIGRPHAYTAQQMQRLQRLCAAQGMELAPCIPTLGHAGYITGKPGYASYDEGRGTDQLCDTLSPAFPETYTLIGELLADWCEHVPGQYLHVGLDESPAMGAWCARQGQPVDHVRMFAGHCNRVNAIVKSLGRRMLMWGDMLYYFPEAIPLLDKDIIVNDWYYYAFPRTPRVEAFNFADTDLTGALVKAGIEVWGVPSVWPNLPIGDIAERWQNVADWERYGRERGATGLLISDWENSYGFCAISNLQIRAFGRLLTGGAEGNNATLADALGAELAEITGVPGHARRAAELLELGRHHITGHADRQCLVKPLATLASPGREALAISRYAAVRNLLPGLDAAAAVGAPARGAELLNALQLAQRLLTLAWKLQAVLPGLYRRLLRVAAGDNGDGTPAAEWRALADEAERFGQDYQAYWDTVRFADDPHGVAAWSPRTAQTLRQWAEALETRPVSEHPLLTEARLECTLHCRHPALPVARIVARWDDGVEQTAGCAMIAFASAYACPDKSWAEYPVVILQRAEPPAEIRVVSVCYGEVGVGEVQVVLHGQRHVYRRISTSGRHVSIEGDVVWLGPRAATPADPTSRPDADAAVFALTAGVRP
ncbi:MAG: family 20 glycosylhydrolase [Kiritimatiellae bacterium]|nr:family 20 glycosylhydrolase [Kiritimatiellia bacterium]